MPTITASDGTQFFYKDWGEGPAIFFSHGWPLNADAWEDQMLFLTERGYRCIAHDRRGHGRSGKPDDGYDMDTLADDLAVLVDALGLESLVLVGHSMGGGEVVRYATRHGSGRVKGIALVASVTPVMLRSDHHPKGLPMEMFDGIRAGIEADRQGFFHDLAAPFFNANRDGAAVWPEHLERFRAQAAMAGHKATLDCVAAFSETDFTGELRRLDTPVLLIHGDDDQMVPIEASAACAIELLKAGELKVYPGGSHGLYATMKDRLGNDLHAFVEAVARADRTAPSPIHP